MKKQKIYAYYAFGYNYSLLRTAPLSTLSTENVEKILRTFINKLNDINLPVTMKIAKKLITLHEEIIKISETNLPLEYATKIQVEINRIDPALDAELDLKEIYILTEKRYSLDILINNPGHLLGNEVFNTLNDNTKKDFSSACMQIALGQPTAAAFHLMRALEEQVKNLYLSFKKTKRLDKPMWGPMINQLRSKNAPKPSEKLLSHLDGIRIHFRNPTQHPDMFYSLDEAQDLLNQTIVAINMIYSELP